MATFSGTPSISQADYNMRSANGADSDDTLDAPLTTLERLTAGNSTADDRVRETVKTVGGWAGAAGGVAIYNAATGATNVAGPWAWAANAVGNVVSGGVGYWAGSEIVETVYDLAVDGEPTHIPAAP